MLRSCPPHIRGKMRAIGAHLRSVRADGMEPVIAGKALGKSIADRFLVRATGRFRAEEMSFPGPSYRSYFPPFVFLSSHSLVCKKDLKPVATS